MKRNKRTIVVSIVAIIVIIFACSLMYFAMTSSARKLSKQLEIAHEYMENGEYDKAIAAFTEAINIDPTSIEAYLGAAEAYVALDDYESAVDILQKGYDVTGSDEIKAKLDEYTAVIEARKAEVAGQVEFDISIDDFKFMGHTVSEGDQIQTIAQERGIPYIDFDTEIVEGKYYIDESEYNDGTTEEWIFCPDNGMEPGEWDGHGWSGTYTGGNAQSNACVQILIESSNRYIDEYYEGPINPGDSIEQVKKVINYSEIVEKTNPEVSGIETIYAGTYADGSFRFSEAVFDTGILQYNLFFNGKSHIEVRFSAEGTVEKIMVSKFEL